jgi:hypothetical protein
MANYKTKHNYRDSSEFGRRLEPYAISVGLGVQAELARVSGVTAKNVNLIYRSEALGWLYRILEAIIRRGAFGSEAEVWDLLNLVQPELRRLRNSDEKRRELEAAITKAFAERPIPEKKETGKVLTREQQRKLRTIAEYMDDLRDDGLF